MTNHMLIACPECERMVSDRAIACPDCAFPVAEEVRRARERQDVEREAQSRRHAGEVDCPACVARGFRMVDVEDQANQRFEWCVRCERSGRSPLVQSDAGFFAVSFAFAERFLAGAGLDEDHVTSLGAVQPSGFRYPNAGPRVPSTATAECDTESNKTEEGKSAQKL